MIVADASVARHGRCCCGNRWRHQPCAALEIDHPIHGCFYLALAELESVPLVTADARLVTRTRGTRWAGQVVLLGA